MKLDRVAFFSHVKPIFGGSYDQGQVDGLNRILDEWERRLLTDARWLAYMLATVKWETANEIQPIREKGGEKYLRSKKYYPWVGEGLVQVTWETNHRKFGATAPGQLLTWPKALPALFDGMIKGMFTGKKLADYFNVKVTDWQQARRIINGMDKADAIATLAKQFYAAVLASTEPDTASAVVPAPEPTPAPATKQPVNWAGAGAAVGGTIVAAQAGVQAVNSTVTTVRDTATQAVDTVTTIRESSQGLAAWMPSPSIMVAVGIVIVAIGIATIYLRHKIAKEQGV